MNFIWSQSYAQMCLLRAGSDRMGTVPVCPGGAADRGLKRSQWWWAGTSREIRAGNLSIHFQVIKPKSGLIGKSSITQQRSITDIEIWAETKDEITRGVCVAPSPKKETKIKGETDVGLIISGCQILQIPVKRSYLSCTRQNQNLHFDLWLNSMISKLFQTRKRNLKSHLDPNLG